MLPLDGRRVYLRNLFSRKCDDVRAKCDDVRAKCDDGRAKKLTCFF